MKADPRTEAEIDGVLTRLLDGVRERNLDAVMSHFAPDPDVVAIGTGQDEERTGRPAIRAQLERDKAQSEASSFTVVRRSVSAAGSTAWANGLVVGQATVGGVVIDLPPMRFTVVFERRDASWLIVQWHWSFPAAARAEGESWPTSLDAITAAVEHERVNLNDRAAPDGTVTLLFSDIENSTPMAEQLGDLLWIELLREHNAIVRDQVIRHGGFEVKTIGDAFMVAFGSARRALLCAIGVQQAFTKHSAEHAEQPVRVRIGLHSGEPVREGNDFYGKSVVLASRIAGQARGGEILVSSLLRDLVESAGDLRFDEGREVALKGFAGVHRIYAVLGLSVAEGGLYRPVYNSVMGSRSLTRSRMACPRSQGFSGSSSACLLNPPRSIAARIFTRTTSRPLPFLLSIPSNCSAGNCLSASDASSKRGQRFTEPNYRTTGSGFKLDGPLSRLSRFTSVVCER